MTDPNLQSAKAKIDRRIEGDYTSAAQNAVDQITTNSTRGVIAQRIAELVQESERLNGLGLTLTPDNPVLLVTRAALRDTMDNNATAINDSAAPIATSATQVGTDAPRQLALPGFNDQELLSIGISWRTPDPMVLAEFVNMSTSPAFRQSLNLYTQNVIAKFDEITLRGIVNGWGPTRTARQLTTAITTMPRYTANTVMRTLYMTSYRRASAATILANADLVQSVIRVAVLDQRTCMACVTLHGSDIAIGQPLADHYNGRCIAVPQMKGRPLAPMQSGDDWFNSRTQDEQIAQMGRSAWLAWQAREIQLSDLARPTRDPVFGEMVQEASLRGLLGTQAERFYRQSRQST